MKNLMYAIAIAAVITGSSCSKDDDNPTTPAAYMPKTANSTWNYTTRSYAPTPATGSYTLTATNKDTTINSKTYRVFTNSGGPNDYYAQVGTDYYQLGSIAALGTQRAEILFLKDAAAGTTWSETQSVTIPGVPVPVSVPVNYQIVKKGFDTTINGKAFTDVTHVKTVLGAVNLNIGGFPVPVTQSSNLNFYYARGVGRIYSRTILSVVVALAGVNINLDDELILTSYTIQ